MGNRLVEAIRSVLGMTHAAPPPEYARVRRRLDDQAARLRAIDAQIDADFAADRKVTFKRRATDR